MKSEKNIDLKLFILIFIALFSLSTNPILCRMAMLNENTDAVSFTILRILSGAIFLLIIYYFRYKRIDLNLRKNWINPFMLFLYAITFSYSYVDMEAGVGTLILFASVQLSMILMAVFYKESLTFNKLFGILIAFFGLVYLLYPNKEFSLSLFHAFLMIVSGVAWAFYTVLGKKSTNAFFNTKDNFFKATIFTIVFALFFIDSLSFDGFTLFLAIFSGVVTSALGYIIWYAVLPKIDILTASILQLLAPVIAICLGILFLDETLSFELFVSTFLILLGIFISSIKKTQKRI